MVGEHKNVWVLVEKLLEMEINFSNEVEMIGYGQTSRVTTRKQRNAEKALTTAFSDFEKKKDGIKLLRFGAYKCQKYGLEPVAEAVDTRCVVYT